jgi:fructose-1,6-bisphosphatase II / sedoheptulose-1,7-bisphosphatase
MQKIAVGPGYAKGVVELDASPADNVRRLAKAKGVDTSAITVLVLDRPRHSDIINGVRSTGAAVRLITDGDVAGVIHCADPDNTGVDMYIGTGGAPEGVLAAVALRCIGGQMQGRLLFRNDAERARAARWNVTDLNKKYLLEDLASGDVMFAATGVTTGSMLKGVRRYAGGAYTHSVIMRSRSGTVRYVEAHHNFGRKVGPRGFTRDE